MNCIVAGLLVSLYIKKEISSHVNNISFFRDNRGKPFVRIKDKNYFVSISHSNKSVCVVVSEDNIGIDIQSCNINLTDCFIKENFCQEEIIGFFNKSNLIRCWAAKEAYLKQTGEGIYRDFKSLSVSNMLIFDKKLKCSQVVNTLIMNPKEVLMVVDSNKQFTHNLIHISLNALKDL